MDKKIARREKGRGGAEFPQQCQQDALSSGVGCRQLTMNVMQACSREGGSILLYQNDLWFLEVLAYVLQRVKAESQEGKSIYEKAQVFSTLLGLALL